MAGNANPCGEFGEGCIRLSEVHELATELTCADFATWRLASLTCSTSSGVLAINEHPCGLLSFTDPSWCHNSRALGQGASSLWNFWRKPCCIAVTDCFGKQSTVTMPCCTDQCSISSKLQTSLYIIMVSTKVTLSRHAGFQISKIVRCLWCNLCQVFMMHPVHDQWENQEKDGRTSSRWTPHRS